LVEIDTCIEYKLTGFTKRIISKHDCRIRNCKYL